MLTSKQEFSKNFVLILCYLHTATIGYEAFNGVIRKMG